MLNQLTDRLAIVGRRFLGLLTYLVSHPDEMDQSPQGDRHTAILISALLLLVLVFQWGVGSVAVGVATQVDGWGGWATCVAFASLLPLGMLLVDALIVRQRVDGHLGLGAQFVRAVLPLGIALLFMAIISTLIWAKDIDRQQEFNLSLTRTQIIQAIEPVHDQGTKALAESENAIVQRLAAIDEQFPPAVHHDRLATLQRSADTALARLTAAENEVRRLQGQAHCESEGVGGCPQGVTTGKPGEGKAFDGIMVLMANAVAERDLAKAQYESEAARVLGEEKAIADNTAARNNSMGELVEVQKQLQTELSSIRAQLRDRLANRTELILKAASSSPNWTAPAAPGLASDLIALEELANSSFTAFLSIWGVKVALVAFELSAFMCAHALVNSQYGALRRENLALALDRENDVLTDVEIAKTERWIQLQAAKSRARYQKQFDRSNHADFRRSTRNPWFGARGRRDREA